MQRQRPGHRIWSFHHRGLLLLAAAVAVMLFFLYGCVAGAAYSPGGGWCSSLSHRFQAVVRLRFPLLSGRIGAVHRMVQCAGRYEKQARSPAEPRHHRQRIIPETSSPLIPPRGASCAGGGFI